MITIDPATAATFVTVLLASAGGMFWLGKLGSRVDRLERDVQDMKHDVQTLQLDVHSVKLEVQNVQKDVQNVKQDVKTMQVDMQNVKQDVKTMQGDVQNVQGDVRQILLILQPSAGGPPQPAIAE